MNRLFSWLQNSQFRALVTASLIAVTFLIASVFGYNPLEATALTTPEATQYQVDHSTTKIPTPNIPEITSKPPLKETANNVREKLNLDQPIAPETKEFIHSIEESIQETVESVKQALPGS
ncbi:hypothetical protein NG798_22060 [Ancylothrix sp. C2]|uniref:hypothetical protein n=1 Tax=Ancylothrix sp. D3o TaxID=2953691 RepID=UPI0021BAA1CC|nr:hypothetical protein [Ancylothrix sp. D3o]MCT7952483.1 hypothetical protein [Ancylothrix sp. D3o]